MFVTKRIKNEIKVGDVLLSFNKANLFSRAITEVTHSDSSHAFLYIGNNKILEASLHGVAVRDLEYYLNYDKYYLGLFRLTTSEQNITTLVNYCMSLRGVKYGYAQIIYLAIMNFLGLKNNKDFQIDLPGIICSELVAMGEKYIDWYPHVKIPAHVTPEDHAQTLLRIV
jgi:uncharacterized protein YycO